MNFKHKWLKFRYTSFLFKPWDKLQAIWWSNKERLAKICSYIYLVYTKDDRDWDYTYFLNVMEWKLQKMYKAHLNDDMCDSSKRIARQIEYALYLLDIWANDPKCNSDLIIHEMQYGRGDFKKIPSPDTMGCVRVEFVFDKDNSQEAHDEWLFISQQSRKRQKDAKKRFFKHLDKYIEGWWI